MARLFNDGIPEYLRSAQVVVSTFPFVMACWYNVDELIRTNALISIIDKDINNHFHYLYLEPATDVVGMRSVGVVGHSALSTTSHTANTWNHATGIVVAANDRRAFHNGGGKGTNAGAVTPANLDRTTIGRLDRFNPLQAMSGMLAEIAIWDLSGWPGATDSDKADNFEKILPSLAKGFSPLFFPLGLECYVPLVRGYQEIKGNYSFVATGTTVAVHPRIFRPCKIEIGE